VCWRKRGMMRAIMRGKDGVRKRERKGERKGEMEVEVEMLGKVGTKKGKGIEKEEGRGREKVLGW
jgi:hypothetical protein